MNLTLWVVQGLLALVFLMTGGMKLFAFEKYKKMTEERSSGKPGPAKGLITFIGISEVLGAMGLILPLATGIAPVLTTLAAVGLGVVMILAAGFHARRKEPFFVPSSLLVLSAFVVAGRGFWIS